jgi:hypothetical protein
MTTKHIFSVEIDSVGIASVILSPQPFLGRVSRMKWWNGPLVPYATLHREGNDRGGLMTVNSTSA